MSQPPVPKLEQLQIRDPYEKCLCNHLRGSHIAMSWACTFPVSDGQKFSQCTCTDFRPMDDEEPNTRAHVGSR